MEQLRQVCQEAGFELFVIAPSLLLILAGDDVCYYGNSTRPLEPQDIDDALSDVQSSLEQARRGQEQ